MAGIESPSPSPALPSPELGRMTSMAAGRKGPPRLSGFFNVVSPRLCHSPGPSLPVARLSQSSTALPRTFFFGRGCAAASGPGSPAQGRPSGHKNFDLLQGSKTGHTSVTADDDRVTLHSQPSRRRAHGQDSWPAVI